MQLSGGSSGPSEASDEVLTQAFGALKVLKERGATSLTYGERLNIVFSALSMVRPRAAAPLKITRINEAWDKLTGEKLFVRDNGRYGTGLPPLRGHVFSELFGIMRDDWQWQPQDWLDIQGFLWIATPRTPPSGISQTLPPAPANVKKRPMPISPVNLILYGPPGTGKTFRTVAEAVRLCGEPVPEDREALMQTYQRLLAAGRIEFVTFHQSMSYEDFVEGRQPMTGSDEDDNASSAGFRLETVPGIFRRIAKRAETSRGRMTGGDGFSLLRTAKCSRCRSARRTTPKTRISSKRPSQTVTRCSVSKTSIGVTKSTSIGKRS